jgi:mono/diheme cytochrome c family protein
MRFRITLFIIFTFLFTACNFSLAEDVTPPPGYTSPTPAQDIGILFPDEPPSPARGARFYTESCAPCHGDDGLGNGPMAASMPVAVPAISLREISSHIIPATWYKAITIGNLERGMPPFSAHSSQSRWDVLAYTYTLSTTPDELQHGANLYAANCSQCHGPDGKAGPDVDFTDQEVMSQATDLNLYRSIAEGKGEMDSFSEALSEDDIWAVTAFLRSLSFDMSTLEPTSTFTPEPSPTSDTVVSMTPEGTPSVETGIVETPSPVTVVVTGTVTNASGTVLERGLTATLILYNTSDGQVLDSDIVDISTDGTFMFTDLYADSQTAYWVSVDYQGVSYYSEFAVFDGSTPVFDLPVVVYDATTDWLALRFDLVHIAMDISADVMQVSELYIISNPGLSTVIIETDGTSLPFIELPAGVTEFTSLSPDSRGASFLPAESGIALPPLTEAQYGVVASFSVPYDRRFEFTQNFPMQVASMSLFVPEGVRVKIDQLEDSGLQDFSGAVYHLYEGSNLPAGVLAFIVTGVPGKTGLTGVDQRSWMVIGVCALGVLFVGLGIYLFFRDRSLAKKEEIDDELIDTNEEDTFGSSADDLADAIIALDEKLKSGEISNEAHEKRRAELKARLKKLL